MTLEPVPMSMATVTVAVDSLQRLPDGSGYSARSGQASVSLTRRGSAVEATAQCDSLERVATLYEELFWEAGATADSLRQALEEQSQMVEKRRSNTVRPVIIAFIIGFGAGGLLTFYLIKRYGRNSK
jgi:predicted esterase